MSNLQRTLLLAAALACAAAAIGLFVWVGLPQRATFTGVILPDQSLAAPELNAYAPDFTLPTLDRSIIRLSDLRGTPVVVNFWATWCGPCIVEMPILQSLYEARQTTGLRILGINLGESAAVIRAWQQRQHLTYDLLVDEQQSVAARYFLRGQPSTYVIAPDGLITEIFFGPVSADALTAALERLDE